MKTIFLVLFGVLVSLGVLAFEPALADQAASQLSNSGVFNHVLHGFYQAAGTWGPIMQGAASRLFWALAIISMVWTFGMMALRKADIGEFFVEFARFTITTGFYWWLLANAVTGMNIGGTILSSLQQLGAEAGGLGTSNLGPSSIVDLGFQLYDRTLLATSELGVSQLGTTIVMLLSAIAILLALALVAINLLLVLASSWILLYGGVFFLGFGGARWTSDIAINYYKSVLGVAAQLLAMVLIVGIGKSFLLHFYSQISNNLSAQELAVMLVVSAIMLNLVNKVPALFSGLASGASVGGAGIGAFGAGAAVGTVMGATSVAGSALSMTGAAMTGAAHNVAGGASAIMAAVQKAQSGMGDGASMPSINMGSSRSSSAGGSALSSAMGLTAASGPEGLAKAAQVAAGAAKELAKGAGTHARQKLGQVADQFKEQAAETVGGRIASVIRGDDFSEGNSLSPARDPDEEVLAFVNRHREQTTEDG